MPAHALSQKAVLWRASPLQKIHEDLWFDRACQRTGMLFWWTTLVVGFGALLGNLVAHLF
jgi:hypothetical protein